MLARIGLLALAVAAASVGALEFFDMVNRAAMGAWPH